MKNDQLHPSEELSQHFAPRREEEPLLSASQVETLLVRHDIGSQSVGAELPNTSHTLFTVRNTIMTITGLASLVTIALFLFGQSNQPHSVNSTRASRLNPHVANEQPTANAIGNVDKGVRRTTSTQTATERTVSVSTTTKRGDIKSQDYVWLTRSEFATFGMAPSGPKTLNYYQKSRQQAVERISLTDTGGLYGLVVHMTGLLPDAVPQGISTPSFYPVFVTNGEGKRCFFQQRTDSSSTFMSVGDEQAEAWRTWLTTTPPIPGLHLFAFSTSQNTHEISPGRHARNDLIKIDIGDTLPQAPGKGATLTHYSPFVLSLVDSFVSYYEGRGPKPITPANPIAAALPDSITIMADTVNLATLIHAIDESQRQGAEFEAKAIGGEMSTLIPVVISHDPEKPGALSSSDYIFWFRPSDELFAALPAKQADMYHARQAAPPRCLMSPNAVLTTAEITYCVSEAQKVHLSVHDLTGKERISWDQDAIAGDNVATCGTETLGSGMYVVNVREQNGSERSRRIWVENAHPKQPGWQFAGITPDATHSMQCFTTFVGDSLDDGHRAILNIPHLQIEHSSLASLGIESDDSIATFYHLLNGAGSVGVISIMRNWNTDVVHNRFVDQVNGVRSQFLKQQNISGVAVPDFQPLFVTDGKGQKRVFMTEPEDAPTLDSATKSWRFTKMDQKFREMDKLIPLLLRAKNVDDSVGGKDLIFWYVPTPQFLAALPDLSKALAKSMVGTKEIAAIDGAHEAKQQVLAYPNPSPGRFFLKITLEAQRKLTITARNLLGQEMTAPIQLITKGSSEEQMDFNRLPEGIYLLDITSEAGERFIQRIVIER